MTTASERTRSTTIRPVRIFDARGDHGAALKNLARVAALIVVWLLIVSTMAIAG